MAIVVAGPGQLEDEDLRELELLQRGLGGRLPPALLGCQPLGGAPPGPFAGPLGPFGAACGAASCGLHAGLPGVLPAGCCGLPCGMAMGGCAGPCGAAGLPACLGGCAGATVPAAAPGAAAAAGCAQGFPAAGGERGGAGEAESQLSAMAAAGLVQMPRGADRAAAHEEPEQRRRAALEEVEKFIRENPRLDERSVDVFRRQDPDIQAAAMDRGTLKDCANPSAALSARIRDAKQERWNPEASTGPKASKEVEAFIRENKVQVGAAKLLRECPPEVQRRVLLRGGLSSFRNPSAMLTTTIKDCKEILQAQKERGLNMDEQNEQQSTKTNESLQLDREHLRRTVEALKAGRHKIFTDHLPGGQGKGGGKGGGRRQPSRSGSWRRGRSRERRYTRSPSRGGKQRERGSPSYERRRR